MLKYVQERQDENIEFLKRIVSIKSLPCEEKEVAEALLAALQQIENLDDAFIDAAGNVIGVIRGAGTGPNVLLNGHMDVVPEGNLEKWGEFDPFEAVIKDGRMYGRGVGDMKAGLVAQFFAFKAIAEHLQETGQKLSGNLIFTGVVQEEPAEMFGMEHLFEVTMPEKELKCDVVYLSEPGGPCVQIGQRGKIELVVKTYGKACHSSMPKHGVNALEMMAPILQAIGDRDGFDLEPDPYLGESSITVTNCIARPGGNLSTIPYECEIAIDRRFSTKLTEQDLLNEFEVLFEKCKAKNPQFQATVEPRYFEETSWTGLKKKVKKWHPAWRVELENEFVQNTFKALKKVGQDLPEGYSLPGTDGSMSCAVYGIPTMIYSNINGETCHREPESILVSEYLSCIEGYIAILTEIYGLDLEAFQQQ